MTTLVQDEVFENRLSVEFSEFARPAASRAIRMATWMVVVCPLIGLAGAVVYSWGWGFAWRDLALLVVTYLATGMGVTIGFHRLFTHRSFETARPIELLLAIFGSMAVQGPLLKWVAVHRRHHQHSDGKDDPHSPHRYGGGVRGVLAGFWHAHIGWMFAADPPDLDRYVGDLTADRALRTISRLFPLWVALTLLLPTALGGLLAGTWAGALSGLLWGGLARMFLLHHVTWSVNSVCHLWGQQPFDGKDESRNSMICGYLAMGEGWHNNHHAFPTSARHGLRWWEFDASYWVIRVLKWVRLARRVRVPSAESIQAKLRLRGRGRELMSRLRPDVSGAMG